MMKTGFIGWRGMVGSVLLQRMREEQDFALVEPIFFTTSQLGRPGPDVGRPTPALQDARDINRLREMDVIISCQGGDYTTEIFPRLRAAGWRGHWIDAASTLRMEMMLSSYWIRSIDTLLMTPWTRAARPGSAVTARFLSC